MASLRLLTLAKVNKNPNDLHVNLPGIPPEHHSIDSAEISASDTFWSSLVIVPVRVSSGIFLGNVWDSSSIF